MIRVGGSALCRRDGGGSLWCGECCGACVTSACEYWKGFKMIAPEIAERFEEDGELSDMEKIILAGLLEDE